MPGDGPLGAYRAYVGLLPGRDTPEALGLHPNAAVGPRAGAGGRLCAGLAALQPAPAGGPGAGRRARAAGALEAAAEALGRLPPALEWPGTEAALAADPSALTAVLRQELRRYNDLLRLVRGSLEALQRALRGQELLSAQLEELEGQLLRGRVPPAWSRAYASRKPLGAWLQELGGRVAQVGRWAATARPPPRLWLGGFTAPPAVLGALLQDAARRAQVPVDSLSWDFSVSTVDDSNLVYAPKEGAWVQGLLLEGAGWDRRAGCLVDAEPLELVTPMPCVLFRPVEARRRAPRGLYTCPCYAHPGREGDGRRAALVAAVELRAGAAGAAHWAKRGAALLLALDA